MSVNEEVSDLPEVELTLELVGVFAEVSLLRYHRMLTTDQFEQPLFYRETVDYSREARNTEMLGPFYSMSEALWGINPL